MGPSFNATLHRSPISLWGTQVQCILSSEPAVTMMQRVMQATPMDTRSSVSTAALSRPTWSLSFLSPCSHPLLHGFPSICLSPMLASLLQFAHLKGMFWFNPKTPHTNSLTYVPLRPLLWVLDPTIQLELFKVTQVSRAGNVQI